MKRLSSSVPAQAGFAVLPVQKQFRRRGAPPWTLHREHRLGRVAHLPQPAAVPAKAYPPTKIRATKSIFLHDEPLSRLNYSEPMFRLKKYTLSSIWVSFQSALIQAAGESTMTLQFMFITYHEMRKVHYWRLAVVRPLQDDRRSSGKYSVLEFYTEEHLNASVTSKNPKSKSQWQITWIKPESREEFLYWKVEMREREISACYWRGGQNLNTNLELLLHFLNVLLVFTVSLPKKGETKHR